MRQSLWIGCLEEEIELIKKSKKGFNLASAQISQMNILNGLEEIKGETFDTINGSVLPPYPIYKDKYVEEIKWSRKNESKDISVGYYNYKYINRVLCKNSVVRATKKWASENYKGEGLDVFIYSMRSPSMAAGCTIKKIIPEARIFLIVTDLPQFMDLSESKLKKILKKIDWIQIKNMQKQFNGFILYSEKMAEYLNIKTKDYIVMEGSYDLTEDIEEKNIHIENKKSIMYSGLVEKKYGLDLLIESFKEIEDPNIELWITGGGNDADYVKSESVIDTRIKYFGFLPSREDVLKMQKDATILINMRLPSEISSAYCFPSKLFEYMSSGTPVLSFKLEGIPKDYYKYLNIIKRENKTDIKHAIIKSINMDIEERLKLGESAKQFIKIKKNKQCQAKKIAEFVERINYET